MDTMTRDTSSHARWWDPLAAFCLFVAAITVALRLDATSWARELSIIPGIVILAVAAGLALGKSRFPPYISILFALGYGAFIITWQLGDTLIGSLTWLERISILNGRLSLVANQINSGEKVTDNLFFAVAMTAIFWLLTVICSYMLTRHGNAWWAILPLGMSMVIIQSFHPGTNRLALYFPVFLFFCLALVARMTYVLKNARWKSLRTNLPPSISFNFIRAAGITITLLILTAWSVPALAKALPLAAEAISPVRARWNELKKDWENAFSSINNRATLYVINYGETIDLGIGASLQETPIFLARTPEFPPSAANYYWRAAVYDRYLSGSWVDSGYSSLPFDPAGEALNLPTEKSRWLASFEIQPISLSNSFFSPGQPLWTSLPSEVQLAFNPDNSVDVAGFRSLESEPIREPYRIQGSLSIPTIKQMREAGSEYPQWVLDRYLALPATITPRTLELAQEITDGLETPYDKVAAITNYLRSNYKYQETIESPPADQEPIDWFLFNYQKGFCNYYATSEVLMLRSLGIPARLAVGYATGEKQDDGRYLVRSRDAHAWPEVYFPGLGWVEFEPTSSQPSVFRPSGQQFRDTLQDRLEEQAELDALRQRQLTELKNQREAPFGPPPQNTNTASYTALLWVGGIILVAGLVYLLWRLWKSWGFSRIPTWIELSLLKVGMRPPEKLHLWALNSRLPTMSRAYNEINQALLRLGHPAQDHHTPAERAGALVEILPGAETAVVILLSEYQHTIFSPREGNPSRGEIAGHMIRKLSWQAKWNQHRDKVLNKFRKSKPA